MRLLWIPKRPGRSGRPAGGPWHDEGLASAKLFSRERGGANFATLHWEIVMEGETASNRREPWNKGRLVGQKAPFKPKEIWAIRVRLQMVERARAADLRPKFRKTVPWTFADHGHRTQADRAR